MDVRSYLLEHYAFPFVCLYEKWPMENKSYLKKVCIENYLASDSNYNQLLLRVYDEFISVHTCTSGKYLILVPSPGDLEKEARQ